MVPGFLRIDSGCRKAPRILSPLGLAALVLTGVASSSGCTSQGVNHENYWYVWPLDEIRQAFVAGKHLATRPGLVLPDGLAPEEIVETNGLKVQPAFVEEKTAAYVTTDLWLDLPLVWLQPAYFQTEDGGAEPTPVPGAPILIDVEEDSVFYSPYWNFSYAVVGPRSVPNFYTSTRALLDKRPAVPLHHWGPRNCPISPLDFLPAPLGTRLIDPTWGLQLPDIPVLPARFNDDKIRLLDFGRGTFDVDAQGVVEALPFFVFARPNPGGGYVEEPGAPRVAGVAPLWSNRAVPSVGTQIAASGLSQPRLGMFWRLFLAVLPAGAETFLLSNHPGAGALATAAGLDTRAYEGRVALGSACFDDGSFPTGCAWLDSQARIERALGAARIVDTDLNVNSPFLLFDKVPVNR